MNQTDSYITPSGRRMTEAEIEATADDVANQDFDVEAVRRRGRPTLGSSPARLVPIRLDPEMFDSLRIRAVKDHATNSEVIRTALREYLAS